MFEELREDIRNVLNRDPAARNTFEVLTCYPGVHALLLHRVAHALWRRQWLWSARMVSHFSRWLTCIEIHPGARLGRRLFIDHGVGVVIGETAEVGDDVTLYQGVTLGGTRLAKGKRHPTLEDGVIVGAGAKVLGPLIVGKDARIGSNAVVVKEVPAGATVVGVPGRIVRQGSPVNPVQQEVARKIGFDVNEVTRDMTDPVAHAINTLLEHMIAVDGQLETLCAAMKSSGMDCKGGVVPKLRKEDFESLARNSLDSAQL